MPKTIKTNLRNLINSINVLGYPFDVQVKGYGTIEVVPPVALTPAGSKRFRYALQATVETEYESDGTYNRTLVNDLDDDFNEDAREFLMVISRHQDSGKFEKYFSDDETDIL